MEMIGKLTRAGRRHLWLTVLAFACASISILALLLHWAGWLPMYFLINLLGAPSLVLLLAAGIYARRVDEAVFFNRLVVGAWGGLAATFAYDLLRLALWQGGLFSYNPFLSHPIFGRLITGLAETTTTAQVVGWGYHFWNGIGFGVMYTLIAGPSPWRYAFIWAMVLELGWLTALPSVLEFRLDPELISISLIGHGAYGVALGFLSQKFIRE